MALLCAGPILTACSLDREEPDQAVVLPSGDVHDDSMSARDGDGVQRVLAADPDDDDAQSAGYPAPTAVPVAFGPPLPADDPQGPAEMRASGSERPSEAPLPNSRDATRTPNPGSLSWPGMNVGWSATASPTFSIGWRLGMWATVTPAIATRTAPVAIRTPPVAQGSAETATPWPSPTPPATSTPDPFSAAGSPERLEVPAIAVSARVEQVGLTSDYSMAAPKGWMNVAWFVLGFRPGEKGNAVIAGHLDTNTGGPAVFWDLNQLRPGDEVYVTYERGDRYTFVVDGSELYDADAKGSTIERIFGASQTADLNLVTCDGAWDHGRATYSKRLVVFTSLVPEKTVLVSDSGALD